MWPGCRRDGLQVGSGIRFGEADAAAGFAFRQARQPPLLLIWCAVADEHIAEHEMGAEDTRQSHPSAGQLLEHDGERGVVHASAAVLFRNVEAE